MTVSKSILPQSEFGVFRNTREFHRQQKRRNSASQIVLELT
jgi:hypothetical protein